MQILRLGLAGWMTVSLGLWGATQEPSGTGHPPSVELTVGTEGPYVAPETLLLVAHTGDADGWVREVVFRANGEVIAEVAGDSRSMGPLPPFRFQWHGVLAGQYVLTAEARDNDGLTAESDPVKLEVAPSPHAFIFIREPEPNAHFTEPARVEVKAVAVDSRGDIRRVVFFANDQQIGVSEFLGMMPIISGQPIPHRLVWEDVAAGPYVLSARAEDAAGKPVESNRVPIVVDPSPMLAEVTVHPVRAEAIEGAEGEKGRLVFRVLRRGPVEEPLTVFYRLRGSATAGEDYLPPGEEIEIPAGSEAAELVFPTLGDNLAEGPETVVVELLVPPSPETDPPPPGRYFVGVPAEAEGVIVDRPTPPSVPVVRLVAVDPETVEPSPDTRVAPGRFRITRSGPVEEPLTVVCRFGGSAESGIDYRLDPPPGPLALYTIPAGGESLDIYVGAVDDDLVEGDESVVAELDRLPLGAPEPVPGNPYLIDPDHARAVVVIHDNDQPSTAELVIHHPPEGAVFSFGEVILIHVTAVDPEGYISRVEVEADGQRVGVSEIDFIRAPDPGTPIEHTVEWNDAAPGEHTLVARAVDLAGEPVESEPVHIRVEHANRQVVLAVEAPRGETSEPGPSVDPAPAVFVVRRVAGPVDVPVRLFFALDGSARNGADYRLIPDHLELPAGRDALEVPVVALADNVAEETETVIFRLKPPVCPAIYPPPPWCYVVGEPAEARILIHDTPPANQPPRVGILHPHDGAVVMVGDTLEILAAAEDPDGQVLRLRLLLDGRELAVAEGTRVRAEWTPEAVGEHTLGAVAVDDQGATGEARPVRVLVREIEEFSFVRRQLPPGYLPGQRLPVHLVAHPPGNGLAWAVEDQPPAGWEVTEASEGGRYDPATGRVKFGPFFNHRPRTLTYLVRVPAEATGVQAFSGQASVNGRSYPVTGEELIQPGDTRHPADLEPPEQALAMDEVTAYATAWKSGQEWSAGPNPIPLAYVTRAGFLWKHGEAYTYDPAAGPPPLCWVPARDDGAGSLGTVGLNGGEFPPMRALPERCRPGVAFSASITVQPPPGTSAWAAEEVIPPGWKVLAVEAEGQYDPASGRIRWGVFFDDEPRELSYVAAAPGEVASVGRFHGTVSFDGMVQPIEGSAEAVATDASTRVSFSHLERDPDGRVRLRLRGAPGQVVVLEVSSDLQHWSELEPVGLVDGELEVEDLPATAGEPRFYRARPVGP